MANQRVSKPTFAQETYASDLATKLCEGEHWKTRRFAESVLACEDREEMSRLISQMLAAVKELDKADAEVDKSHKGTF